MKEKKLNSTCILISYVSEKSAGHRNVIFLRTFCQTFLFLLDLCCRFWFELSGCAPLWCCSQNVVATINIVPHPLTQCILFSQKGLLQGSYIFHVAKIYTKIRITIKKKLIGDCTKLYSGKQKFPCGSEQCKDSTWKQFLGPPLRTMRF